MNGNGGEMKGLMVRYRAEWAVLVCVTAAAVFMFSPREAEAQVPLQLGLGAGALVPTGDLADQVGTGVQVTTTLRLGFPLLPIHLRGDGMIGNLSGKGAANDLRAYGVSANVGWDVIPLVVTTGYLIGGVGYYWTKPDLPNAGTESDTGWNVGAGVRFNLLSLRLFAEARYNRISTDAGNVSFVPVTVGIMF
jgi:opacity protein-like surface antigen